MVATTATSVFVRKRPERRGKMDMMPPPRSTGHTSGWGPLCPGRARETRGAAALVHGGCGGLVAQAAVRLSPGEGGPLRQAPAWRRPDGLVDGEPRRQQAISVQAVRDPLLARDDGG